LHIIDFVDEGTIGSKPNSGIFFPVNPISGEYPDRS
jgi:hypothetical protein